MKVLLIGPYPPPNGGISVHVYEAARQLRSAGIVCRVLNTERRAAGSGEYISVRSTASLARVLFRHAGDGWMLHLHTNGHNDRSWMLAVLCGLAGRRAPARVLTVHSGLAPAYLRQGGVLRRLLARTACALHSRVVAVSAAVRDALIELGVPGGVQVQPAFLMPPPAAQTPAANSVAARLEGCRPVLAATLFFRPEYGFDLLLDAMGRLRERHPRLVCVVMGGGDQQAQAERAARVAGLPDHLIFAGNLPHDDCLALMARADVFVRPALADGDSNSVREALALGVCTVASDVAARPAGTILFRTGDSLALTAAIEQALATPPLHAEAPAAIAARETSRGLEGLLDFYRSLPAASAGLAGAGQAAGLVSQAGRYGLGHGRTRWGS